MHLLYLLMNIPKCTRCHAVKVKRNGNTRHGQQRYKCTVCNFQFSANPTNKLISAGELICINKLLLERLSLRGICRVMDVSMTWLLAHIEQVYTTLPSHLHVLSQNIDFQSPLDEQLDLMIYQLLEKKGGIPND